MSSTCACQYENIDNIGCKKCTKDPCCVWCDEGKGLIDKCMTKYIYEGNNQLCSTNPTPDFQCSSNSSAWVVAGIGIACFVFVGVCIITRAMLIKRYKAWVKKSCSYLSWLCKCNDNGSSQGQGLPRDRVFTSRDNLINMRHQTQQNLPSSGSVGLELDSVANTHSNVSTQSSTHGCTPTRAVLATPIPVYANDRDIDRNAGSAELKIFDKQDLLYVEAVVVDHSETSSVRSGKPYEERPQAELLAPHATVQR